MAEKVDGLETIVDKLTRENQRLSKENKNLKKRLSKYEEPNMNSSNSSTPPSKEGVKSESIRRTRFLREKSDNSVGGQLGHEGNTWKIENTPDERLSHQSDYCNGRLDWS